MMSSMKKDLTSVNIFLLRVKESIAKGGSKEEREIKDPGVWFKPIKV